MNHVDDTIFGRLRARYLQVITEQALLTLRQEGFNPAVTVSVSEETGAVILVNSTTGPRALVQQYKTLSQCPECDVEHMAMRIVRDILSWEDGHG